MGGDWLMGDAMLHGFASRNGLESAPLTAPVRLPQRSGFGSSRLQRLDGPEGDLDRAVDQRAEVVGALGGRE